MHECASGRKLYEDIMLDTSLYKTDMFEKSFNKKNILSIDMQNAKYNTKS